MFCCPIRTKKDSSSGVEKRDSSDREEYYFDCEEPSSKVKECARMHKSAMFERSFTDLFSFPRTLMLLLFVAVVFAMPSTRGRPEPSLDELAKAMKDAKAYLYSGPRQSDPEPDMVYEASGDVGADQPSSSDEQAELELCGAVTDAACPNIGTEASGHPGELLWHYEDLNGIEYGPFPETRMRKWWLDRGFGPDLLVRLPTWTHFSSPIFLWTQELVFFFKTCILNCLVCCVFRISVRHKLPRRCSNIEGNDGVL